MWRGRLSGLALACGAAIVLLLPAPAEAGGRPRLERKTFTDAQIIDGFLKTAFGAEFHLAGRVDRIRKYEGPVRVFINGSSLQRRTQLERVLDDIAARVQHLDIAVAPSEDEANVTVRLVRDRDLLKTFTAVYGGERARELGRSLDPQCLSSFRKNENYAIEHSDVILTIDTGDFIFRDCAYEEVLQSLGPINDTDSVPWTMFNDDVRLGYFGVYDQYLLNILYDPRIKAGMTVAEVKALLPAVLPDVRAWVTKLNALERLPEPAPLRHEK
jgi:hypothetical protein